MALPPIEQVTQDFVELGSFLYEAVIETKAQAVLETGTDVGDSARIFETALRQTGGHLWSIDIKPPPNDWYNPYVYYGITLIQADVKTVIWERPLDVLFLDDHNDQTNTAEHVLWELQHFGKLVRPGGRILIHDVLHPKFGPGIFSAVNLWSQATHVPFTIKELAHGLVILTVPATPLASPSDARPDRLRPPTGVDGEPQTSPPTSGSG